MCIIDSLMGNCRDWVITWQLDGERKVNFYFRSDTSCKPNGDTVPEDVVKACIRFKPQVNHCWEKYVLPLDATVLDPTDIWDEINFDQNCHGLNDDEKSRLLLNHVLIREWNGENGYENDISHAWVVDPLGRVWEIGDDFIEGWHALLDFYPGEEWPLGPLTI